MMVKANCKRASRTGSKSIVASVRTPPGRDFSPNHQVFASQSCSAPAPNRSGKNPRAIHSIHSSGPCGKPALGLGLPPEAAGGGGPMAKRAKQTEAKAAAKSEMPGAAMLDKDFGLKEQGTDIRTEFIAGLTTFLTMVYIVFVNPTILS